MVADAFGNRGSFAERMRNAPRLFAVKRTLLFLIVLVGSTALLWLWRSSVKASSDSPDRDPEGRVARARESRQAAVAEYFRAAGVSYPPRELFLRTFKHEGIFEVWGRDESTRFKLIRSYPISRSSGKPGPKRREGDLQVPEGFYIIDAFNPISIYHLSLRVSYPNASDRVLSDPEKPGFDIYIHGGAKSIGCVPIGDEGIEEVYLMALDAGNRAIIPIHIFPARMSGASWEEFTASFRRNDPSLLRFWENLQPGFEAFERTHTLPRIVIEKNGRYRVQR